MTRTGHKNSIWIAKVQSMLRSGLGVEDIAVRLECNVEDVRREVGILREMGVLKDWRRQCLTQAT